MIENPDAARGPLRRSECGVEIRIDEKAHRAGLPLDGVKVKVVCEVLVCGETERSHVVACAVRGARAMQRTLDGTGFLANIFHDVDLAALGPACSGNVFSEHPEGGPHS